MWSPSYDCFSTGMCDDCVKTLIDWQEGPLGHSVPCSVLATAVNSHKTLTWKPLKPGKAIVVAGQVKRC